MAAERQLTHAPHGHVLTNVNCWSPDSRWVVYDVRSDPAGGTFDGDRIERVDAATGDVQVFHRSRHGARCGVATCHPRWGVVAFITGPEHPTVDWSYAAHHRHGLLVDPADVNRVGVLDARDLTSPFTPGALRGGSHVHVFSPNGQRVSFTYEDAVAGPPGRRGVGVTDLTRPVAVPPSHPRNHGGSGYSVVVTTLHEHPAPGSDQIDRAVEEGWVTDRTLAVQGRVMAADGSQHWEAFAVDVPDELTTATPGTVDTWPTPPAGTAQRRLTHTAGLATAPRHWLRASPDGTRVAFLMADAAGVVQLWTVPVAGGAIEPVTTNRHPVASAFTWTPDGRGIAHVMDGSVCLTDVAGGVTRRLTDAAAGPPRPEACVCSPDGRRVAFVRTVGRWNQVFAADVAMPT